MMVARRVADGRYQEMLAWLQEGELLATDFPGYLGSGVLAPPPGDNEFQMIFRFSDAATLGAWEHSASRKAWLVRGGDLFAAPRSGGSVASTAGLAQRANGRHAGSRRWRSGWRSFRCHCCSTLASGHCWPS